MPNQNKSYKNSKRGIQRRNFYNRRLVTKQNSQLVLNEKYLQSRNMNKKNKKENEKETPQAGCSHWNKEMVSAAVAAAEVNEDSFSISNVFSDGSENCRLPCVFQLNNHRTPYAEWKLYFPNEKYCENSLIAVKLKAIESHINNFINKYDFRNVKKYFWFPFNLTTINNDENFKNIWSTFNQDLVEKPEETLNICGLGVHQYVSKNIDLDLEPTVYQTPKNSQNKCLKAVRPRIQGFGPLVGIRSLKINYYDRLVAIRGTVIKVSAPVNLCTWMAFRCSTCRFEQSIWQPEGALTAPTSCKEGCRRSNFQPILSSSYTKTEAFQIIRLQESMLSEHYEIGRVPCSIEVELTEELVDSLCPGDDITITGILKVKPQEELKQKGHSSMHTKYIRAVSVMSNRNTMSNLKLEFTEKDMKAIKLISEEPYLIRLLVHSLCPAIYGHEMVKAGLLLGLFGGSNLQNTKRAEIHVLVVGDPALGKSQILKKCANVSPRGVFVCGTSSSSAGLTVSVRREMGEGYGGSLEAGALVLSHQGTCCIDELDKMTTSNQQSLLEVMEQQTVSVAKAGVLCSLPAKTSILAAANPAGGHYDRSKTVSENLKMNPALLSRFDLIFILLDRPDSQLDNLLLEHIRLLHTNDQEPSSTNSFLIDRLNTNYINRNQTLQADDRPLYERLKLNKDVHIDVLPHVLLQKYIAYAKKNIHPTLTPEAAEELKKFYLEMRKRRFGVDSIPVTPRQLEALVRLTQARARIELSKEVQLNHVLDVLEIIYHSMIDVFITDGGALEMERNVNGRGMSQTSQANKFLKILQKSSNSLNKNVFNFNELKDLAGQVGVTDNFIQILDSLNLKGFLLKKGKSIYKFIVH